jgi:RNA-directed DNA polymerase
MDLARIINPIVSGWINFYGRFYKSMLFYVLRRINERLARWAMRKYKRLHGHYVRAVEWLAGVARRASDLFAHWRVGVRPDGWTVGAG